MESHKYRLESAQQLRLQKDTGYKQTGWNLALLASDSKENSISFYASDPVSSALNSSWHLQLVFNHLAVGKPPLTSQLTWLLPADDWAVLQVSHYAKTSLYIFLITTNEENTIYGKAKTSRVLYFIQGRRDKSGFISVIVNATPPPFAFTTSRNKRFVKQASVQYTKAFTRDLRGRGERSKKGTQNLVCYYDYAVYPHGKH